jgi:hypothetical protein
MPPVFTVGTNDRLDYPASRGRQSSRLPWEGRVEDSTVCIESGRGFLLTIVRIGKQSRQQQIEILTELIKHDTSCSRIHQCPISSHNGALLPHPFCKLLAFSLGSDTVSGLLSTSSPSPNVKKLAGSSPETYPDIDKPHSTLQTSEGMNHIPLGTTPFQLPGPNPPRYWLQCGCTQNQAQTYRKN